MKYILISLALILICGFFASEILALRCITTDGLQVEEVRRVIKKCMKKITSSDDGEDVRGYEEYENFESEDFEMKDVNNGRGGGNGGSSNNNDRMNANNNYNPRFNQYDERSTQTGGNYYEMNRPRNNRHDPWVQQQFNPYQQPSPYMHDRGNNNYFGSNQQRGDSRNNNNNNNNNNHTHQNKNINNDNSTDKHERDRACIFQCFFQELKMTNEQGFPDRNKMMNVLATPLRDRELKDFYIDSIQECNRVMSLDPKAYRDNCLFSKNIITCLGERAKMNCADFEPESVIF